jgi:hypothetical protein
MEQRQELCREAFGSRSSINTYVHKAAAPCCVVLNQRSGTALIEIELFPDHILCVVSAVNPVSSRIPSYPRTYIFRAAVQHQKTCYRSVALHIPSLANVAGEAVQDDKIRFLPSSFLKKPSEYPFCEGKVIVFEKPAFFLDIADEPEFIRTKSRCRLSSSRNAPQFTAEIEMMASSAQDASLHHMVSLRGLSRAGRSDQKDSLNGFQPISTLVKYNPGTASGQVCVPKRGSQRY